MVRLSIPFSQAKKDSKNKIFCQQIFRFVNRSRNKALNRQLTNRAWILINFCELKRLFKERHEKQWLYRHLIVVSLNNSKQFLITLIKESSIRSHECQLMEQFLCSHDSFSVIVIFALFHFCILRFFYCDAFKIDVVTVVQLTSMRPFKVLFHIPFARWHLMNVYWTLISDRWSSKKDLGWTSNGRIKRDTTRLSK